MAPRSIAVGLVAFLLHPAIVDIDVLVSVVGHAGGDHDIGGMTHVLLGDAVVVDIPAIPAHRRRQGQRVADDDLERPHADPLRVLGFESCGPLAPVLRDSARDDASRGVKLQALGQAGGREVEGTQPRAGNAVEERLSRPGAVDPWAVDLRLRPRLGRQNHSLFRGNPGRIDGDGPPAGHDKFGLGPICMVEVGSIACRGHHQPQLPDTQQWHIDGLGLLAALHDAAVEEPLAVTINHESDRSPAAGPIINADERLESFGFAVEIHVQCGFRVGPHAFVEDSPSGGNCFAGDALIDQRLAPPAGHLRKIQFSQAHHFGAPALQAHNSTTAAMRDIARDLVVMISTLPFAYHQIVLLLRHSMLPKPPWTSKRGPLSNKRRVPSRKVTFFQKKSRISCLQNTGKAGSLKPTLCSMNWMMRSESGVNAD